MKSKVRFTWYVKMWIKKIKLYQFRNYKDVSVEFSKGVNVILGENGVGKTSIMEAIGLMPLSKSIRTSDEKELISLGAAFAKVECSIQKKIEETVKIVISKQGKFIELNGQELKKISDLAGVVKVVSFLPKDVELFKSSPSSRRKFIDSNMSMLDKRYLLELSEYSSCLENVRLLLKNDNIDSMHLDILLEKLSEKGFKILTRRRKFVSVLNEQLESITEYINGDKNKMKLIYLPDINVQSENEYLTFVKEKIEQSIEAKTNKLFVRGIHQDDLSMDFDGKDLAVYGSQGQNRIAVISLKLALVKMIKTKFNEEPILILDDVLSELDDNYQKKLIQLLKRIEQVFITGTQMNLKEKYTLFNVEGNIVRRMS